MDGRLCQLVPLSRDIVEAADGKHPPKKDILLRLAGSWILNGIVEIKQSERGVPACILERSEDTAMTLATLSLLLCSDHMVNTGGCLLKWKSAIKLFNVIVMFSFTFWRERNLFYWIHLCYKWAGIIRVWLTVLLVFWHLPMWYSGPCSWVFWFLPNRSLFHRFYSLLPCWIQQSLPFSGSIVAVIHLS